MTKRFGFTLAEVLITLGIIGVVAAMSIPTLIANTNSAKFRSQFKKTVATLNQAALMGQAQYDYDFAGANDASVLTELDPKAKSSIAAMLAGTLAGVTITNELKLVDNSTAYSPELKSITAPSAPFYAKLADGSIFVFNSAATNCTVEPGTDPKTYINALNTAGCIGWIDVNGVTMPNAEIKCNGATGATDAALYKEGTSDCQVKNDAAQMKDVFTVVYHDGIVEPASNAARYVLSAAK
jgi:prepilin-type N-terminal cleavage/methylation domain-containing protein